MADADRAKRVYGQYCGVARALDVVGERWSLLLVRELLLGPLRYNDLLQGLPGIGTNLLAKRLRDLEDAGIVEKRVLPPPANVAAYALTRRGQRLEGVVVELGRFGGRLLPQDPDDTNISPRVTVTGLKMTFRAAKARGVHATFGLELDGRSYTVIVNNEHLEVRQGEAADPWLLIRTTARDLLRLLSGAVTPGEALEAADYQVLKPVPVGSGDSLDTATTLTVFVDLFGWAARPPAD